MYAVALRALASREIRSPAGRSLTRGWISAELPDDQLGRGLARRQLLRDADLANDLGAVEAPVAVSDEIMPGVVSLPHGFGHDADDSRLRVAREHAGVNVNLLTDEAQVDALSGNAVLNGVPVEISPA